MTTDRTRSAADWPDVKKARVDAARARRRVIFNDDGYELDRIDADTPEGFLRRRLAPLAGTHVTTIAYSVIEGEAPLYDSRIQPLYGAAHGGPPPYWPNIGTNLKAMRRAGHCPLRSITDFAHDHGMESFASLRMNDVHDSFLAGWLSNWKKEHPQLLVDTRGVLPEFELYVSAQDFSHEPVRRRKLEVIEEIADRYDVDGFELDYIRHPVLFSRRLRGQPCAPDEVQIITAMMHRIRQVTDAAAARRGRPILIGVRIPDSFQLCLDNGMDLEAWLEKDLIDILIAGGGYAPFSMPIEALVDVADRYGVAVYPCVREYASVTGSTCAEGVRGLASNWYRAGCSGLYFWNLGTPFEYKEGDDLTSTRDACYACLDEVGDPEAIAGLDKVFGVDGPSGGVQGYYALVSSQRPLPVVSKRGVIREGVIGRVGLQVGDDVATLRPSRALLQVTIDNAAWEQALLVRFNGTELTGGQLAESDDGQAACQLIYELDVPPVASGLNHIEFATRHGKTPKSVLTISAIGLKLEYA